MTNFWLTASIRLSGRQMQCMVLHHADRHQFRASCSTCNNKLAEEMLDTVSCLSSHVVKKHNKTRLSKLERSIDVHRSSQNLYGPDVTCHAVLFIMSNFGTTTVKLLSDCTTYSILIFISNPALSCPMSTSYRTVKFYTYYSITRA